MSSPYLRAQSTAEAIGKASGFSASFSSLVIDERLREKEFGILDRLTRLGIEQRHPELAASRQLVGKFYYRPPAGESWCDVILRLRSVLDTISLHYGGKHVLIVAHQVVVLCMRYLLENMDEKTILAIDAEGDVANCAVTEYVFDEKKEGRIPRPDEVQFRRAARTRGGAGYFLSRCKRRRTMSVTEITREFLLAHPLPEPEREGDKQARGRVLVIAGSVEIPGAALLAGLGSLRAGAGILQIATCRSNAAQLGMAMPEAMVIGCNETKAGGIDPASAERLIELGADCDAVLIGPGMTDPVAVAELTQAMLKHLERPALVLDALAFSTLRADAVPQGGRTGRIIVTPHSGEMAKFLEIDREEVDNDPLQAARRAAAALARSRRDEGCRNLRRC